MMLVCSNLFYCTWTLYLHTEAHASSPDARQVIWFSLPYGGIYVSDKPSSVCAVPAYAASAPFSCRRSYCIHRLRTLPYFYCCWSGRLSSNDVKKTFRFGNFMSKMWETAKIYLNARALRLEVINTAKMIFTYKLNRIFCSTQYYFY